MRRLSHLAERLGLAVPPNVQLQELKGQLALAQVDLAHERAAAERWRRHHGVQRDRAEKAERLAADRLSVIDHLRSDSRSLEEQLGTERDNVRQRDRTIAALNADLAVAQLGDNVAEPAQEIARLRAAVKRLEDQADDYRKEIGRYEAKNAQPSSRRWDIR